MLTAALNIEGLTVKNDRVVCEVSIDPRYSAYTTPALIEAVKKDFPDLPKHTCKNARGDTFASVMDNTSIPHLLEHMVIDLQVRELASHKAESSSDSRSVSQKTYLGTTEWINKKAQRARIEVSFTDDLSVLRAFRDASQILNKAMV